MIAFTPQTRGVFGQIIIEEKAEDSLIIVMGGSNQAQDWTRLVFGHH